MSSGTDGHGQALGLQIRHRALLALPVGVSGIVVAVTSPAYARPRSCRRARLDPCLPGALAQVRNYTDIHVEHAAMHVVAPPKASGSG